MQHTHTHTHTHTHISYPLQTYTASWAAIQPCIQKIPGPKSEHTSSSCEAIYGYAGLLRVDASVLMCYRRQLRPFKFFPTNNLSVTHVMQSTIQTQLLRSHKQNSANLAYVFKVKATFTQYKIPMC